MISKHVKVYILAAVMVGVTLTGSAYAIQIDEQKSVPRYGEDCAHGHNGFDCKPSQFRVDIDDLQERVIELERNHKPSQ